MIHKKQLTQFAKNILRSQKGLQNHQLMHPGREWAVGLLVAIGFFTGSAIWSALAYVDYSSGNIVIGDDSETQPIVYREALVNSALEIFEKKAFQMETLVTDSAAVTENETPATSTVSISGTAVGTASSTETINVSSSSTAVADTTVSDESEPANQSTPQPSRPHSQAPQPETPGSTL